MRKSLENWTDETIRGVRKRFKRGQILKLKVKNKRYPTIEKYQVVDATDYSLIVYRIKNKKKLYPTSFKYIDFLMEDVKVV